MKRMQFELPEERADQLDELLERTGLKTRVNLFNHALTLFEWVVRERESGRIIASMDEETGKYKELEMPGLPQIKHMKFQETRARQGQKSKAGYRTAMRTSKQKRGARIYGDLDEPSRT